MLIAEPAVLKHMFESLPLGRALPQMGRLDKVGPAAHAWRCALFRLYAKCASRLVYVSLICAIF
jgi:hypothetical protein